MYARAIRQKGSPLPNCFGFIDGTVRPICRPEENQRIVYNGHKQVHGLKYQSVALPNKAMSAVHMSVEWLYGNIINYFKFLDFKKNLKISLSAVGKMYIVCAIFCNALTCMYGNPISEYFALDPPTIQDYFA